MLKEGNPVFDVTFPRSTIESRPGFGRLVRCLATHGGPYIRRVAAKMHTGDVNPGLIHYPVPCSLECGCIQDPKDG